MDALTVLLYINHDWEPKLNKKKNNDFSRSFDVGVGGMACLMWGICFDYLLFRRKSLQDVSQE